MVHSAVPQKLRRRFTFTFLEGAAGPLNISLIICTVGISLYWLFILNQKCHGKHRPLHLHVHSFKNYTKVSGVNLAMVKVVVMLVDVSRRSRRVPLPPAASLYGSVLLVAPGVHTTSNTAGRRALDDQVQTGQPGVW